MEGNLARSLFFSAPGATVERDCPATRRTHHDHAQSIGLTLILGIVLP